MMRHAAVLLMAVGCAAQCDVGTAMCGGIGALQCKEGFACAPAGCDPLTTADCAGCCIDCTLVTEAFETFLTDLQSCTTADQCGTPLTGTSCGCTRNLVGRADMSKEMLDGFYSMKGLYEQCGGSFISTCDCPAAFGFKCDSGKCAYNLDSAPVPVPPACKTCGGIGALKCEEGQVCESDCDGQPDCAGCCVPASTPPTPACNWDQCAGIAGFKCEKGFDCFIDPKCEAAGGADCGGCCVKVPTQPAFCDAKVKCGGKQGFECEQKGYVCMDDPSDSCDPATGGADCQGCCVEEVVPEPAYCDAHGPFCGKGFDACKTGYTCTVDPTCTGAETDRCSSCCVRDEPVSNKCETDATCPTGTWCRAVHDTASGQGCLLGKECVPFVQKGETCGGFVLPCYYDQCAKGLQCECSEPTCDVPGTCVDATPAFCDDKGPFCGRGFAECKPGYTCTFDPTCTDAEIATDRCSSCCVRDVVPAFCDDKGPFCGAGLEKCKPGYTCTADPTCTSKECSSCCVRDVVPAFCDDKGPFCGRGSAECKPGYTCTFDPTCTIDEIATDRCSSCCVRDVVPAFCDDKGPFCGAGLEKCKPGYTCTVDPTCTSKECSSCCVRDVVPAFCDDKGPFCGRGFAECKPGYTCTFDPTCTIDEIATDRCSSCCVRDVVPAFCDDKGPFCGAGLQKCKPGYTCTVDPTCTGKECSSCCVRDVVPAFCDDKGPFCGRGSAECKPGYTCTFDPTCTIDEIATDRCSSCCVRDVVPAFCDDKGPFCGAGLEKCKPGYTCTADPTCTGKECSSCCVRDEVAPCCMAHPVCKEGYKQKKNAKCRSKNEKKCYIEELCCKKIACRRIRRGWNQFFDVDHYDQ